MRPRCGAGVGLVAAAAAFAAPAQTRAQHGLPAAAEAEAGFLERVRFAIDRFAEPDVAIAEGYRRIGPDFPGMGEHWVLIAQVVRPQVDVERPAILTYTRIEGRQRLLGAAYVLVLQDGDAPPDGPFPVAAWHDHANGVDEEALALISPRSMDHADGDARVAMVHVWTHVESPDGILSQNNWALPFLRIGLPVPGAVSTDAARAASLAGGGTRFYEELARGGAALDPRDVECVRDALREAARSADAWVDVARRRRGELGPDDVAELVSIWARLWSRLESGLSPEGLARLSAFAPEHG